MVTSIWEKSGSLPQRFWECGILPDCPVYDMHGHMGSHSAIYFKRCEAPEMVAHLKRSGIRKLVFSHHQTLWSQIRNAEVNEICRRYPDVLRMYAAVNPHHPEYIREDLSGFDKLDFAFGLKFLADYHQVPVNDSRYEYALDFANERGLPILYHTWGKSPYNGGKIMLEVASKYPHVKHLFGHSLYGDWDYVERAARDLPERTWFELTAIPGNHGWIERLVDTVGSDRILYGTDMPWFDEYQGIGGVLSAKISEEDMRNILYRNARKLLGETNIP